MCQIHRSCTRLARGAALTTLTVLFVALAAPAALAEAPSNDTFAGAAPVTLGSSVTMDTTQATTDANDAEANATCGARPG